MDKSLVNALNRLERAGSANSRATQKLHEAAAEVAWKIEEIVPVGVDLPRGYRVRRIKSNVGQAKYLVKHAKYVNHEDYWIDGDGEYLHGDFSAWVPGQSRTGSLTFAQDIAEGLLDEIAAFLEERAQQAEQAADELETAV